MNTSQTRAVAHQAGKPSDISAGNRSVAIDAFRGLTIILMIFVNSLAGVRGVPAWMEHMPGDQDGMTFVDVIFPAFLFIVGMSIPFAQKSRSAAGFWLQQRHVLQRALGLIVMGVFMVNAEEGYNEYAMHMPIGAWCLASYACFLLVWLDYRLRNATLVLALRAAGVVGLIVLGLIYRAGPQGELGLTPQWWGILGLIGWAYLYTNIVYQLARRHVGGLLVALVLCATYSAAGEYFAGQSPSIWWSQAENAAHTSITLTGLICAMLFFPEQANTPVSRRFMQAGALVLVLSVAGILLHHVFIISKNQASPPWCMFSAAICVALFGLLYWLIDLRGWQAWTRWVKPVAINPLLTYLIPFMVYAASRLLHLGPAAVFQAGVPGMVWCAAYAVLVVAVAALLNRHRIRLQL